MNILFRVKRKSKFANFAYAGRSGLKGATAGYGSFFYSPNSRTSKGTSSTSQGGTNKKTVATKPFSPKVEKSVPNTVPQQKTVETRGNGLRKGHTRTTSTGKKTFVKPSFTGKSLLAVAGTSLALSAAAGGIAYVVHKKKQKKRR